MSKEGSLNFKENTVYKVPCNDTPFLPAGAQNDFDDAAIKIHLKYTDCANLGEKGWLCLLISSLYVGKRLAFYNWIHYFKPICLHTSIYKVDFGRIHIMALTILQKNPIIYLQFIYFLKSPMLKILYSMKLLQDENNICTEETLFLLKHRAYPQNGLYMSNSNSLIFICSLQFALLKSSKHFSVFKPDHIHILQN